jgi:hypothetical protein
VSQPMIHPSLWFAGDRTSHTFARVLTPEQVAQGDALYE